MSRIALLWLCWLLMASFAPVHAASEKMVRIEIDGNTRTGTVIAHANGNGWFLERDGRLDVIRLDEVQDYEVLGSFRGLSAIELREQLAQEFGREFQVHATGHYLVVTAAGTGQGYGALFEQLYREFVVAFSARGFRMREPQFPLVAVVFPDESAFLEYCRAEGVQPRPGLRGYYLPSSNRVALFDAGTAGDQGQRELDSTILHEAIHQVAFNTGLHSRMGTNPLWLVEGLATAYENDRVRENQRSGPVEERLNLQRFRWFLSSQGTRQRGWLARLVSTDKPYSDAALDAYAEGWAMMFYLLETRSANVTGYLRKLAERDPLQPYTDEERLQDFQQAFGRDLSLLEAHLQRYFEQLAAEIEIPVTVSEEPAEDSPEP